jgi:hypothetical protein
MSSVGDQGGTAHTDYQEPLSGKQELGIANNAVNVVRRLSR